MKALKTVPKDMSSAYNDVMERIKKSRDGKDKDLAMRILSWLFHAQRTLHMDELLEALAVGPGEDDSDVDDTDDDDQDRIHGNMLQPFQVIECCKSLVLYDESSGLVRFTHYTVQQFIASHIKQSLPPAIDLAKTCLSYLGFDTFNQVCDSESMEKRVQKYKFGSYAAQFWALHTKGEVEKSPDVQQAVLRLFASENKRNSILQMNAYVSSSGDRLSFTKGQTLLHVIAKNGLAMICRLVLDGRVNGNNMYMLEVDI